MLDKLGGVSVDRSRCCPPIVRAFRSRKFVLLNCILLGCILTQGAYSQVGGLDSIQSLLGGEGIGNLLSRWKERGNKGAENDGGGKFGGISGSQLPAFLSSGKESSGDNKELSIPTDKLEKAQQVVEQIEQGKQLVETAESFLDQFGLGNKLKQPIQPELDNSANSATSAAEEADASAEESRPENTPAPPNANDPAPHTSDPADVPEEKSPGPLVVPHEAPQTAQATEENANDGLPTGQPEAHHQIAPTLDMTKSAVDDEIEKSVKDSFFSALDVTRYDRFDFDVVTAMRNGPRAGDSTMDSFYRNVWKP